MYLLESNGMSPTIIILGIIIGIGGVNIASIFLDIRTTYWLAGFGIWMAIILILSKISCKRVEGWMERNFYSKRL